MNIIKQRSRTIAVMLAALAALGAASPTFAYSVYRKVETDNKARVMWTAESFTVRGDSLSFYYFPNDAAARAGLSGRCLVKIDLGNQRPDPRGEVGNARIPIASAVRPKPFPWAIVPGSGPRWIVPRDEIITSASDVASTLAAAGFKSLATTPGSNVTVIDGNKPNGKCAP